SATALRTPARLLYFWERNKLLTLLLCYEASTLWRLAPLYLFDGLARLLEDLWLLIKRPPGRTPSSVALRYAAALRALGWIVTHRRTIQARRARIQRTRNFPDGAIT